MFTQLTFVIFCVLVFAAGFVGGMEYQYQKTIRRFREMAEIIEPCCGNCKEYNGSYCTKYWNNMDDCYKVVERDSKDPEDPPCEDWEYDETWEE